MTEGRQPREKDAGVYRKRQPNFYRSGGFEADVEGVCTVRPDDRSRDKHACEVRGAAVVPGEEVPGV